MGASVSGYWPDMTDDQADLMPGFWQDSKAWGDWMAEREKHPDVMDMLARLRVDAVATVITEGMEHADVKWVTPHALAADALWLRHLVSTKSPGTSRIIETYAIRASGESPPEVELAQDLLDVAAIARHAARHNVPLMTLEVNW